jgi:hypothetical protein
MEGLLLFALLGYMAYIRIHDYVTGRGDLF